MTVGDALDLLDIAKRALVERLAQIGKSAFGLQEGQRLLHGRRMRRGGHLVKLPRGRSSCCNRYHAVFSET